MIWTRGRVRIASCQRIITVRDKNALRHTPIAWLGLAACLCAFHTQQIRLGSGTLNMPNSHPAAIAAQVSMIDHLLQGRFIMGISPGGLMSDA
ncbi:MAG: LLM class flavin-dependent oxidoreductase, partial [Betaproteobacteria bacterium]|nr:LLM class flavin-dependent oxidoreductase [Betaproteobacteria bacterium]